MIMYGAPQAGKSMSLLSILIGEIARKHSDRPDDEFWAWLESTLSAEAYQQCRSEPIAFLRKLHTAAWHTHLAELKSAEVQRVTSGNTLPGDMKVAYLDSEQTFDPDWSKTITPLFESD